MLMAAAMNPPPPLPTALRHTGEFWTQTGIAIAHHPLAVLICALVPAAARGYILLRGRHLERGQLALLEFVVTIWRVLLCGVAVWIACSGREWQILSAQVGAMAAWQVAINRFAAYAAHHLRIILWQLLFYAVAFLLAGKIVAWLVQAIAKSNGWLRESHHRMAAISVLRNLILVPVAVVYAVEMARPVFRLS